MGPMIIWGVAIKAYTIMTLMTLTDEVWNMTHPRPEPNNNKYLIVNWEKQDFIFYADGSYVLRKKRKADNKNKAEARRQWHEREAKQLR